MGAMPRTLALPLVAALFVGSAACSGAGSNHTAAGRLQVVAAENFWGNLVQQIGGDHVAVTSLISNPGADPHLYEPGTSNGLAVATAGVVVVNGAGYDPFMDRLLNAAPSAKRDVVRVSDVLHISGSDPNPHLWYDAPALPSVVQAITSALIRVDPAHDAAYRNGAARTVAALQPLEQAVTKLKQDDAGDPVAYTERVPGYLLSAAGLTVLTPPGFARSIEDGTDPSASDISAMRDLITGRRIKALLYNEQATSPITSQLQSLARSNGIPIVPVTETMPLHDSFESWQLGQVRALTVALAS
jgi:zinc/manganese transport system substrate-binding protein